MAEEIEEQTIEPAADRIEEQIKKRMLHQILLHLRACFCSVYEYDKICTQAHINTSEKQPIDAADTVIETRIETRIETMIRTMIKALMQDITDHIYVLNKIGYPLSEGQLAQLLTQTAADADRVCIGIAVWKEYISNSCGSMQDSDINS